MRPGRARWTPAPPAIGLDLGIFGGSGVFSILLKFDLVGFNRFFGLGELWGVAADRVNSRCGLRFPWRWHQSLINFQLGLLRGDTLALAEEVGKGLLLETIEVFLGELLLNFLCASFGGSFCSVVATVASITVLFSILLPLPLPAPVSVSVSASRAVSRAAAVTVVAALAKSIAVVFTVAVTISVTIPVYIAASVSIPLPLPLLFALPLSLLLPFLLLLPLLLAPFPTLLFSPLVFFPLLPSALLARGPLRLTSLHLLFFLDFAFELSLLLLDRLQLGADPLPLGAAGSGVSSVLLISLGAADALLLGCLVANLGAPQLPDVGLDGSAVNQCADDLLCFLVDAAAVQRAVDKSGSFPALQRQ